MATSFRLIPVLLLGLPFWRGLAGEPASAGQKGDAPGFQLIGQVESKPGVRLKGFFCHAVLRGAYHPFYRKTVSSLGGRFKFAAVPAGTYVLTVSAPRRGTAARTIEMTPSFADAKGRIHATLPIDQDQESDSNRVSVAELAVPEAAWKEVEKAQDWLSRAQTEAAVEHLKLALEKAPRFPTALNTLGTIYYQTGRYEEARGCFTGALELDRQAYPPLVNLGGTLLALGHFKEAVEVNLRAAGRRPSDPLAHSQLGLSHAGLQEWEQALASLQRAKQLEPAHFSNPQLSRARIFLRIGRLGEAVSEYKEFLALHPDAPSAPGVRRFIHRIAQTDRQDPEDFGDDGLE